jgi:hypothetical protein
VDVFDMEDRWWTMEDPGYTVFCLFYAGLNVLLIGFTVWGMGRNRKVVGWSMMIGFILVRTLFLASVESPEPRYVLECYPIIFVFAAAAISKVRN